MNTCRRNAGGNKRGPELEDGRSERFQDREKKRVITPDFSIKDLAYKSTCASRTVLHNLEK